MALIVGTVEDIGMVPLSGDLSVTSVDFRPEGDVLVAPEIRSFPIVGGVVDAELLPGPCRVTIRVGSHARRSFDVAVPNVASLSLAALVESGIEYEPVVVSVVAGHRAAAEDAADRAEAAADDVDVAIVNAAGQVVADVEADRVAAEAARTGAETARDAAAGSASTASSRATAASGSASAAAGSASDAAGSASAANSSAGTATAQAGVASTAAGTATSRAGEAAGSASAAAGSATAAASSAEDAELWATSFGLTATSTTGAPGTSASVTVTGSGPEYGLAFTVPRGDKGPKGDDGAVSQAALDAAVASLVDNAPEALNTLSELATSLGNDPNFATTVSTEIGKRALVDGAPAAYNTLGKLVAALVAGDLGGSTDAGVLTGTLTDQVDASQAVVEADLSYPGGQGLTAMPLFTWLATLHYGMDTAMLALEGKSDVGHTHTTAQVTGLDAALAGKAPTSHTHTKAQVGLGNVDNTSDVNKPVSTAQQAAINAKIQLVSTFPASPTAGVLYLKAE